LVTPEDFQFIGKLLLERSAVVLEPGKEYLVETRLAPIARKLELESIADLVARLRMPGSNGLITQTVEALVTNETQFFRDVHPFESLRKTVIPDLIRRRSSERALAIWCCASSTGQEPYSLAMLLREHFPELQTWKVSLLATDLSRDVLARAREGKYNQIEVNRGLPAPLLVKYFQQQGTHWQLKEEIRRLVEFRELNLSQPWPFLPRMDLILNRNVMIYFDIPTKKSILSRLARILRPDGYLLLGGSETTFNLEDSFRRVEDLKAGFYQLAGASK
jgi:chemotaxis protein methyltransferase CheR